MDETAKEVCLLPQEKFRTEVYLRIIDQSISKNLYRALKAPYSDVLPTLAKRQ